MVAVTSVYDGSVELGGTPSLSGAPSPPGLPAGIPCLSWLPPPSQEPHRRLWVRPARGQQNGQELPAVAEASPPIRRLQPGQLRLPDVRVGQRLGYRRIRLGARPAVQVVWVDPQGFEDLAVVICHVAPVADRDRRFPASVYRHDAVPAHVIRPPRPKSRPRSSLCAPASCSCCGRATRT